MADFDSAFAMLMKAEGGYNNDAADLGGETYRGVARKFHPYWPGWVEVDICKERKNFPANLEQNSELQAAIKDFYRVNFWARCQGELIESQNVAEAVFKFAVLAGVPVCARMVQFIAGAKVDGVIGPKTANALNAMNKEYFLAFFALAQISRHVKKCEKRLASRKFFYGWVRRALEGL